MVDELLVVRAGVTDYELSGRLRGTLDVPLAAAGRSMVERVAADLASEQVRVIRHADDGPSRESAGLVAAACGVRPRGLSGLVNLDQGLWQGMLIDEIRLKQPRLHRQWLDDPWSVVPPEGESLDEACERVDRLLGRLLRRQPGGRLALVVPWPLDRVVLWVVAGRTLDGLWEEEERPAEIVVVPLNTQWKPVRPQVRLA